ncbi:Seipin [Pleurostoma richardsiae]|uniref:Seipin n=1 Tax=Pleurostoma richardsiae TaxID=41990 RepID=A0AA38VHG4_9PEZI|nr:Seipin [Pleurostoma richardsiae]
MDYVRATYNAATSKTAQRTLLNTILAAAASSVLFGLAAIAYLLFYHNYLPDQITTIPIHLQYGYEVNPYGIASLADKNFKDLQDYDITVTLKLPRSPPNLDRGNFMLALHLLDDASNKLVTPPTAAAAAAQSTAPPIMPTSALQGKTILHSSARPAIVPYTDPLVSLASRLLFLAYHIFFPASETATLRVPMAERLQFRRGTLMPTSLLLDVQAGQALQVYSAAVTVTAQLRGLRWLMYTWRITSFLVFTTGFWLFEVVFMGLAWVVLSVVFGGDSAPGQTDVVKTEQGQTGSTGVVKKEAGIEEDVPMTFPTSSRQPPLRYEPSTEAVKDEAGETSPLAEIPPLGGEADDEDEEEEDEEDGRFRGDSGIGTSYSDRDGGSVRRRASRGRQQR